MIHARGLRSAVRRRLFSSGLAHILSVHLTKGGMHSMAKAKPAKARPKAEDPVKVDAKHYKVEVENKQVRVLRITYGPQEKTAMHGHPAGAVVFLTGSTFRFAYRAGKPE